MTGADLGGKGALDILLHCTAGLAVSRKMYYFEWNTKVTNGQIYPPIMFIGKEIKKRFQNIGVKKSGQWLEFAEAATNETSS